jgi:membrane protein
VLLTVVVLSYRQVVHAYPSGGGDYEVAMKNHGQFAALVVASALLTDYVLTVAVSVSSGTDNIISAFPSLNAHRVLIALVLVVLLAVSALAVVLTGGLAEQAGKLLGVGSSTVDVWNIAKWPVLVVLVSLMFSILYWASPNVKQPGFRWVTPGGLFGVLVWVIASAAFAFYVANFGSYNKTYGALGGIIVFLVWLWISNIAVLLGAELNAEVERGRRIEQGMPEEREPFVEPRDTRKMSDAGRREVEAE